jgi:hypothetical protein
MDMGPVDLSVIDEGKNVVKPEDEGTRRLLKGFEMGNIKIHLLSDDLSRLYNKKKYQNLFDIGVMSIHSGNQIGPEVNEIFKKGSMVHVESADNLVTLQKDQRAKFRVKLSERA